MIHQRPQSIFWIEVDKIIPNPEQPRQTFNEKSLAELAESIRQYGVLQPLVVIRKEREVPTGTCVEYELIAGERRLRASKLAGIGQVPVIIREDEGDKVRLELAIIENLQREDLNPLERARAFKRLIDNFNLKHFEIANKLGKSREYVSNSMRILGLPEEMQGGLAEGLISEGHTRPLLMLSTRPEEQMVLYREIIYKKITVREAEKISRRIAYDRAYKKDNLPDRETRVLEEKLSEEFGTRVQIEKNGDKGKISIDFFSGEELNSLLAKMLKDKEAIETEINEPTPPLESSNVDNPDDLIKNFSI